MDGVINVDELGCLVVVGVEGKVIWLGVCGIVDLVFGVKIIMDIVFDIVLVFK